MIRSRASAHPGVTSIEHVADAHAGTAIAITEISIGHVLPGEHDPPTAVDRIADPGLFVEEGVLRWARTRPKRG
jgi:hypothetical protein